MKKFMLLAASSVVLASTSAFAGDEGGWYLRGNAGIGAHNDVEFKNSAFVGDAESQANIAGSLGLGYDFSEYSRLANFRLELDGDTLWTDMGTIGDQAESTLKLRTNSIMLNAIYDFGSGSSIEPFLGIGAGLIQTSVSADAHDFLGEPGGGVVNNSACAGPLGAACRGVDKDSNVGMQGLAGIGIALSDNLTWDTHYSYQKILNDVDFDYSVTGPNGDIFNHVGELDNVGQHSLVTGLRLKFGAGSPPPPPPPPPMAKFECADGSMVYNAVECPQIETPPPPPPPPPVQAMFTCSDGVTTVTDMNNCPPPPPPPSVMCPDGSMVSDAAYCNYTPAVTASYNNCGPSNVAIFNVPLDQTPKQMERLGTMPEFGDSHGLTPAQFYEKLQSRYNSSAMDKAYLNYLFKSMGYANGFADADVSMFSEEVLPVGTSGLLGLGEAHHYNYSILPSSDRDRQAFRIQSANGSVINFMKTCGNYMYACN